MESGSILDSNVTASSTLNSGTTPAKNGRLNYTAGSSWCAAAGDSNPYLQIDLHTLHFICAVSTQGNSQADEWVETYTLQTSTDGTNWTDYTDSGGRVKVIYLIVFTGIHLVSTVQCTSLCLSSGSSGRLTFQTITCTCAFKPAKHNKFFRNEGKLKF